MKKIFFSLAIISAVAVSAQSKYAPPAGNAAPGDTYGAGVTAMAEKSALTEKQLAKKLKQNPKAENVAVKGKVTDVCEKRGCWLTLETDNNERFFVKMKDYAFFVPKNLKGKEVVLEGNAEVKTISVEELQHYAADAKKSQAEINAITKPKQEIRFMADGIKVIQ